MSSPSGRPPRGCGYAAGRSSRAPVIAARDKANRRNAGKSTGPRTAAGKAASSRNAVRHGLRAASPVPAAEIEPIAAAIGEGLAAWMAAEMQLMLGRIGDAKGQVYQRQTEGADVSDWLPALETLAGYERKVRSLRRRALRRLEIGETPFWPNEANRAQGLMR
jgi:hypothetical protein